MAAARTLRRAVRVSGAREGLWTPACPPLGLGATRIRDRGDRSVPVGRDLTSSGRRRTKALTGQKVSGARADGGWNVSGPSGGDRRSAETVMSEDRNGRITYPLWPTESAHRPLGRFTGR